MAYCQAKVQIYNTIKVLTESPFRKEPGASKPKSARFQQVQLPAPTAVVSRVFARSDEMAPKSSHRCHIPNKRVVVFYPPATGCPIMESAAIAKGTGRLPPSPIRPKTQKFTPCSS
jgi:hypothetical protein